MILISCSNNTSNQKKNISENHQQKSTYSADTTPEVALWADDHILEYLEANKERLTEVDSLPITYMKESTIRNQRKYAAIKIGQNFEHRFVTNQWIYIDSLTKEIFEQDLQSDSLILWTKNSKSKRYLNEIPSDGKYLFDAAFTEWQGKSMGVKVTVIIKGDSIKVTYAGGGNLTAEIGENLDTGIILKHKSGNWIIGQELSDKNRDEVGGCTGGPSIIDFENKKYWMC